MKVLSKSNMMASIMALIALIFSSCNDDNKIICVKPNNQPELVDLKNRTAHYVMIDTFEVNVNYNRFLDLYVMEYFVGTYMDTMPEMSISIRFDDSVLVRHIRHLSRNASGGYDTSYSPEYNNITNPASWVKGQEPIRYAYTITDSDFAVALQYRD